MLFGNEAAELKASIKQLTHEHEIAIDKLKQSHKLELKEKEFEMEHFKDEELKKKDKKIVELEKDLAEYKKENKMLEKMIDMNADVVDVKNLVEQLIKKLPEVNLKSLTINSKSK